MLSFVQGSWRRTGTVGKEESFLGIDDDEDNYEGTTSDDYFLDMFTMLMEEDAVIYIIAGSADENSSEHGTILISLPEEMTLRMRTMIYFAFPQMFATELKSSDKIKEKKLLPDELFLDGMTRLLLSLFCREFQKAFKQQKLEEAEKKDFISDKDACDESPSMEGNGAFTPIEDLNLGVRSYHCLKVAGINSVEKLRTMTDEDFTHVRNLGKKSTNEIKQKLAEAEKKDFISDKDACDESTSMEGNGAFTPIEKLNLGVRSYHCLKLAGINSVEKLRSMTDKDFAHVRNLGKKSTNEIKQKLAQIQGVALNVPSQKESYMDRLNNLIGLEDVKEQVRKITAFARMKKDMATNSNGNLSMSLNMEFVGNPGTAKTTVARIVSGIFNEVGLLPGDGIIEVGRSDLVAKYEGQTALKVKEVFQRAKGKVLFIDEAYSLEECGEGRFGDEAINTIVQEMENNREDTIVIFAGYPDKIGNFFVRNPGLRSRVPFCIGFKDYSADDIMQIVKLEARKRGFSISLDAQKKVLSICAGAREHVESGNGRLCRNLVENAILEYAVRVYGGGEESEEEKFELKAEDFKMPEYLKEERTKNAIGFQM